jgi:hypothetical protein
VYLCTLHLTLSLSLSLALSVARSHTKSAHIPQTHSNFEFSFLPLHHTLPLSSLFLSLVYFLVPCLCLSVCLSLSFSLPVRRSLLSHPRGCETSAKDLDMRVSKVKEVIEKIVEISPDCYEAGVRDESRTATHITHTLNTHTTHTLNTHTTHTLASSTNKKNRVRPHTH